MENQTTITAQYKAARLAGLLYLIAMATGLLSLTPSSPSVL